MDSRLCLGFPNLIDKCTLSGGSWSTGSPRANLQNADVETYARTADAANASTVIDFTVDKNRPVGLVVLVNHNLSTVAQYRLRSSNSAGVFTSPVTDTGTVNVWPVVFPFGSQDWLDDGFWNGRMSEEQRAGYPANLEIPIVPQVNARYWRLELFDAANLAGYVQAARLFVGSAWQPTYNYSYGLKEGRVALTEITRGKASGRKFFAKKKSYRTVTLALDWLTADEAYINALELQLRADRDGEIYVIPDPTDATHAIRRNFLAQLREFTPVEHAHYGGRKSGFVFEEII